MESKLKFLIVDDFGLVRSMIKQVLVDLGQMNSTEASGGAEALKKIREADASGEPFNYVFIDWIMPEVNGIEVVKECMKDEKFKHIQFIMVSAEQDAGNVHDALQAGAKDYITKPFSSAVLAQKIKKLIGQKNAA
jgi:two-component system chemotaxis response regulator CheY